MIDQALAAPVRRALPFFQPSAPGRLEDCGIGSHDHFCLPLAASKPRTSPDGWLVRLLSAIAEPTITVLPTTAGGEVSS